MIEIFLFLQRLEHPTCRPGPEPGLRTVQDHVHQPAQVRAAEDQRWQLEVLNEN